MVTAKNPTASSLQQTGEEGRATLERRLKPSPATIKGKQRKRGLASRDKRRPSRPATSTSPLLVLAAVAGVWCPLLPLAPPVPAPSKPFSPKTDFVPALSCKGAASCRRWIRFTSVSLLGGSASSCFFQERGSSRRSEQSAQEPLGLVILRGEVVFLGGGETRALSSCPISRGFSLVLAPRGQNSSG